MNVESVFSFICKLNSTKIESIKLKQTSTMHKFHIDTLAFNGAENGFLSSVSMKCKWRIFWHRKECSLEIILVESRFVVKTERREEEKGREKKKEKGLVEKYRIEKLKLYSCALCTVYRSIYKVSESLFHHSLFAQLDWCFFVPFIFSILPLCLYNFNSSKEHGLMQKNRMEFFLSDKSCVYSFAMENFSEVFFFIWIWFLVLFHLCFLLSTIIE